MELIVAREVVSIVTAQYPMPFIALSHGTYLTHGWPEGATGENVCSSRCFNGFHHQHIHLLQNDKFENIW